METNQTIDSVDDLSALAWVHDELRRSIETAHKSLRRYVRECENLTQSDVDALDPTILRTARSNLHQGVGALELVGLSAAAQVLRASENAVQRLTQRGQHLTAPAVDAIEKSSFGLLDYLARMLAGRPVSPVALFPQYVEVQALAGADRVHPADLWPHEWRWRDVQPGPARPIKGGEEAQSAVETYTLALMRQATPAAAAELGNVYASLANGVIAEGRDRRLASVWQLAAAFFESQALELLKPDVYVKRIASRLLVQLRISDRALAANAAAGASSVALDVSERLAQDLLFFCAQADAAARARTQDPQASPSLQAVRRAWGLSHATPVNYNASQLGRFDPAWIAQAKKRVATAKETWSGLAADEMHRLQGVVEQFHLVGDSLTRLFAHGESLAGVLHEAAQQTAASEAAPPPGLAMEVATALLYVEAALDDADFDDPKQGERVRRLAERIGLARSSQAPTTLEPWMEELYRRVADRQTMGSVVQELRSALSESEKAIDQYFRDPSQRELLMPVPGQLQAMRGVLSVLGLDQASLTIVRMREDIEPLLSASMSSDEAQTQGVFERMAGNLGALGFMIDMLSVQPQMAKSLFKFDAASGVLQSVVRRSEPEATEDSASPMHPPSAVAVEPKLIDQVESLALQAAHPEVDTAQVERNLERLAQEALVNDQRALAETMSSVKAALKRAQTDDERQEVRAELAQAMADFVSSTSEATMLQPELAPLPTSMVPLSSSEATPAGQTGLEGDAEMRAIFLEEAREVVQDAAHALQVLETSSTNLSELTNVRRAFHTFKGSSRMVGLKDFGEAAWSCEQLYNARLAERPVADADLIGFTQDALAYLSDWVDAIEQGELRGHESDMVRRVADGLRLEGRRGPLNLPGMAPVTEALTTHQSLPAELALNVDLPVGTGTKTTPMHKPRESFAVTSVSAPMVLEASPDDADSPQDIALPTVAENNPRVVGSKASHEAKLDLPLDRVSDAKADPAGHAIAVTNPRGKAIDVASVMGPLSLDLNTQPGQALTPLAQAAATVVTASVSGSVAAGIHKSQGVMDSTEAAAPAGFADTEPAIDEAEIEAEKAAMAAQAQAQALATPVIETIVLTEPVAAPPPAVPKSMVLPDARPREAESNIKHIGPLRVSVPLFNIYLNEAEEQSGKLVSELQAWKADTSVAVGDAAESLAHSLAGNSATVGYGELSSLARSLEHALKRCNERGQGDAAEAQLFLDAADEVRKLLHQFAAGFLKAPQTALVARLAEHDRRSRSGAEVSSPSVAAIPVPPLVVPTPAGVAPSAGAKPSPARGLGEDDDLDSVDALDEELFAIFEEEGVELFPRLSTHMRAWVDAPTRGDAAQACLRDLHTIKGSARLAGAMRLGELAHRLESSIESLVARGEVKQDEVEAIQIRADALGAAFDQLRGQGTAVADDGWLVERMAPEAKAPSSVAPSADVKPAKAAEPLAPMAATNTPVAAKPAAGTTSAPPAVTVATPSIPKPAISSAVSASSAIASEPVEPAASIDWARFQARQAGVGGAAKPAMPNAAAVGAVRVKAALLDRLVNHAGEVSITRSRIDADVAQLKGAITDLTDNLDRMRNQLREIELQAESQINSRLEAVKVVGQTFDPLEMDRFTRFQELTRMLAESVNDVATVHRGLQRTVQSTEDQLAAQARLTRELQDNLLRTRMVEFDSLADRLYRVVRQTAKEVDKQVRLDIVNGTIEVDRGVLERMAGAFEHLLRNCITHGIEPPAARMDAGKDATGTVTISLLQEGNEVTIEVRDDGAGLNFQRIHERALATGLVAPGVQTTEADLAPLIFAPGFTTAQQVTELAGRGVGMDVVRNEVNALGGRVETSSVTGQGVAFKLIVPLTTAVTQVVMLRAGDLTVAMPSTLVETVRRADADERDRALHSGRYQAGDEDMPFYWLGSLLQDSLRSTDPSSSALPVVVVRSAQQRVAIHVDEVLGNQEVVVKHLGPQLSRLPGLAGVTLLPSGQVVLIYNPVALSNLYGPAVRAAMDAQVTRSRSGQPAPSDDNGGGVLGKAAQVVEAPAPLVLVVDDSLTVRRVTQRLLQREGYRVALAKDGLDGLEKLAEETPAVLLSDIEMPRMDGFDLVRNLRADARWRTLPVIMITSRIAAKHKEHATQLGVNHYLGKPYAEDELLRLIASFTQVEQLA